MPKPRDGRVECEFPLVVIGWLDHAGSDGKWKGIKDVSTELESVHTVGWLIKETKYVVVVASTLCGEADDRCCNDDTVIDKSAIQERIILVEAK